MVCLVSCGSSKQYVSSSSLEGDWDIISVNGYSAVPGVGQGYPYIHFDSKDNSFWGSAGCNKMFGIYRLERNRVNLTLGGLTMMACPEMNTERRLVKAFDAVEKIKYIDSNILRIYRDKKTEIILKKKQCLAQ